MRAFDGRKTQTIAIGELHKNRLNEFLGKQELNATTWVRNRLALDFAAMTGTPVAVEPRKNRGKKLPGHASAGRITVTLDSAEVSMLIEVVEMMGLATPAEWCRRAIDREVGMIEPSPTTRSSGSSETTSSTSAPSPESTAETPTRSSRKPVAGGGTSAGSGGRRAARDATSSRASATPSTTRGSGRRSTRRSGGGWAIA